MNVFNISEKSEYRLSFQTKGTWTYNILFWFYTLLLLYSAYFIIPYSEAIYSKLNLSALLSISIFLILVFLILFKILMNLRYLGFNVTYTIEKAPPRKYIYFYKILGISSSPKVVPEYNYLISQNIRFFGSHGFYIYIFNIKAKEVLKWNIIFRLLYDLFHPPYIRVYRGLDSEIESKEKSLSAIREIESFLEGEISMKTRQKTNLMRINVTVEDVRDFVSKGGDLNARDTILGNTALFYVCGTDPELPISKWVEPNFIVLGEMIKLGLDVNACNYKNERVIDYIRKVTKNVSGEPPSLHRLKVYLESNGYKK